MSPELRRWLAPAGSALAVLLVVAVLAVAAWSDRGAESAGGPAAGGSGDRGAAQPGGEPGGGAPGYPGTAGPVPEPTPGEQPPPVADGWIAVDSYYRYPDAPRRLALNYTNGVPACYGTAGAPEVTEREDRVVVRLPRIPPPRREEQVACIEVALMLSVDVTLAEPLGDRAVVDGSRRGYPVEPAPAPYDEEPVY